MPSLVVSCEPRSPPASLVAESPPRKKFKFPLKLKSSKAKNEAKPSPDEADVGETNVENVEFEPKEQRTIEEDSIMGYDSHGTTMTVDNVPLVPPLPFTGLANLGNTCYVNAVLQVLRYCPEFSQSIANLDDLYAKERTDLRCDNVEGSEKQVPKIIHSIHKLACEMANAEENYNKNGLEAEEVKNRSGYTTLAVHPSNFVKKFSTLQPMFGNYQQHDAQEFLRSFLSLVEDDCTGLTKGNNDDDKANMKDNVTAVDPNKSKVRGGCKYPNGVPTQSVAEPTAMTLVDDNRRTDDVCVEGLSNDKSHSINKTVTTSKSSQRNPCQMCSANDNFNLVQRLFEGTLQLQTRCLNCEVVRERYEAFQDISVPVQNSKDISSESGDISALSDSEDEGEKDLNLSWAISKFASIERLQGDNKYFCDNCGTLTEAEISTYFEKLPQVLTIHLMRFQTSYAGQGFFTTNLVTKVTKSLHTPQQLSVKKWCSQSCSNQTAIYKLFGVVMHNGMSSCSGHYLSYVNIDVINTHEAQLNDCKCDKDDAPACSCLENIADNKMEVECEKEEKSLQDDSVKKLPARGIEKYFKPISRKTDCVQTSKKSQNLPCTSCQASNGSLVGKLSSNCESKPPINRDLADAASEHCKETESLTDGNDMSSNCEHLRGKWLKFDDAEVHEINDQDMDEVLSPSTSCYSTPYLLFYFRV